MKYYCTCLSSKLREYICVDSNGVCMHCHRLHTPTEDKKECKECIWTMNAVAFKFCPICGKEIPSPPKSLKEKLEKELRNLFIKKNYIFMTPKDSTPYSELAQCAINFITKEKGA
jgi:hypothetical protein